jgi:VCBS repeat-containing protein
MIRAHRVEATAQDDASLISGWNIAPNVAYSVALTPGATSCGVFLFAEDGALIASGAALVGTEQPCVLIPQPGQTLGMIDPELGWHLLLTTIGTERQRTIRINPSVDLPDEIHPIYADDDLALVRATAGIDASAHYIDDLTVSCPLGFRAVLGDVASGPVDGAAVVGQVESITWAGTPNGASEQAVIRRHVAIAPAPAVVPPAPPVVVNDAGETAADETTSGNVLTNDSTGLSVVAVNGLSANVGATVAGSNGGVFTIASTGAWTFDPSGDFALLTGSETAETSVMYHASDGVSEAGATLTITVSSGAAPALWTPAQLTTAQWLDVSDTSTLTLDGTAISQISDKSGNDLHATQTGTSRPTRSGNLAVFDGTNDSFNISVPQARPSHVFAVLDTTALQTGWRIFMERTVGSSPYPPALYVGRNTQAYYPGIYWGTSLALVDSTARQNLRIQEYRIGSGVVGLRSGGGTELTATTSQSVLSTWIEINTVPTYSQQSAFSLGEVLIINQELSDADRQRVEGYLAHKWDAILGVTTLVAALPSGHPYKTSPPTI